VYERVAAHRIDETLKDLSRLHGRPMLPAIGEATHTMKVDLLGGEIHGPEPSRICRGNVGGVHSCTQDCLDQGFWEYYEPRGIVTA